MQPDNTIYSAIYDSPIGPLFLAVDTAGSVCWCDAVPPPENWLCRPDWEACGKLIGELQEYFLGSRKQFTLPRNLPGTGFTRDVYQAMTEIPYGSVISYTKLAEAAGSGKAARAAGNAAAENHLLIVIPCHRVVPSRFYASYAAYAADAADAADGTDSAYRENPGRYRAGGGDAKRYLLRLEQVIR